MISYKGESKESATESSHERCVICGKRIEYGKNDPISERHFYVEGAGQLCNQCFHDVYSH